LWRKRREIKIVEEEEGNKNCGGRGGKQKL